jgi:GTP cyclohydrolase II
LGISEFVLLTNNPEKSEHLRDAGFNVKIEMLEVSINPTNKRYLQTKAERLGHLREVK